MPTAPYTRTPFSVVTAEVRGTWGWILALGILLICLGTVCVAGDATATFVTVVAFGWLLLLSGVVAFGVCVSHLDLERVPGLSAQRFAAWTHRIPADSISFHRSGRLDPDSGVLLHCGRAVSGNWRRNAAVSALGLGRFLGNFVASAGSHVAYADAGFQHLVHRIRHWCRYGSGRRVAYRLRHGNTRIARGSGLQSRVNSRNFHRTLAARRARTRRLLYGKNAGCGL